MSLLQSGDVILTHNGETVSLSQSGDVILTYNGESVSLRPGASLTEALADNTDPIVRFGVRRCVPVTLSCPQNN